MDAKIDRSAWQVPPLFDFLAAHGNVEVEEMDRVFNLGIGYTLIVRPAFANSVVQQLRKYGEEAFIIGKTVKGSGKVHLY